MTRFPYAAPGDPVPGSTTALRRTQAAPAPDEERQSIARRRAQVAAWLDGQVAPPSVRLAAIPATAALAALGAPPEVLELVAGRGGIGAAWVDPDLDDRQRIELAAALGALDARHAVRTALAVARHGARGQLAEVLDAAGTVAPVAAEIAKAADALKTAEPNTRLAIDAALVLASGLTDAAAIARDLARASVRAARDLPPSSDAARRWSTVPAPVIAHPLGWRPWLDLAWRAGWCGWRLRDGAPAVDVTDLPRDLLVAVRDAFAELDPRAATIEPEAFGAPLWWDPNGGGSGVFWLARGPIGENGFAASIVAIGGRVVVRPWAPEPRVDAARGDFSEVTAKMAAEARAGREAAAQRAEIRASLREALGPEATLERIAELAAKHRLTVDAAANAYIDVQRRNLGTWPKTATVITTPGDATLALPASASVERRVDLDRDEASPIAALLALGSERALVAAELERAGFAAQASDVRAERASFAVALGGRVLALADLPARRGPG